MYKILLPVLNAGIVLLTLYLVVLSIGWVYRVVIPSAFKALFGKQKGERNNNGKKYHDDDPGPLSHWHEG